MPEVCCRHCGRKLSSVNVKTCPECKKKLYKGDIVNCELLKNKIEKKKKSPFERMDERTKDVVGSADRLLLKKVGDKLHYSL